jgi:hypothetical protein
MERRGPLCPVDELREGCEELPESAQKKIMGDNVARCYGPA